MVIPIPTPDNFKFHSHFRPVLKPHSHPRNHSLPSQFGVASTNMVQTVMAVRLTEDLRPSADASAVHTSSVTGQLQAASVLIA